MTQQESAVNAAKWVLTYLNLEKTEARVKKITSIINDHFDKYKKQEIVEKEKIVVQKKEVVKERLVRKYVYVPNDKVLFNPVLYQNIAITFNEVAEYVCKKHGITLEQLKITSKRDVYLKDECKLGRKMTGRRCAYFVDARQEFMKIIHSQFSDSVSIKMMCDFIGYMNHSSVHHILRTRKKQEFNIDMPEVKHHIEAALNVAI